MNRTTDYVRIALLSAVVIVVGLAVYPLLRFIPIPLAKVVFIGPLYSMAGWILLQKSRLPGTIVYFGGVIGAILTVFMPYMFLVSLAGGIGAQITGRLFELLGADRARSDGARCVSFSVFQLPLMYVLVLPMDSIGAWLLMIGLTLAVAASSWTGLHFGRLLHKRLSPAVQDVAQP